jgi:hypothetical protein
MADMLSHPYSLLLDRRSSKAPLPGVPCASRAGNPLRQGRAEEADLKTADCHLLPSGAMSRRFGPVSAKVVRAG